MYTGLRLLFGLDNVHTVLDLAWFGITTFSRMFSTCRHYHFFLVLLDLLFGLVNLGTSSLIWDSEATTSGPLPKALLPSCFNTSSPKLWAQQPRRGTRLVSSMAQWGHQQQTKLLTNAPHSYWQHYWIYYFVVLYVVLFLVFE